VTIETPELGDRSYVVGDGGPGSEALVIDPQRDLDRVQAVLSERAWTCVLVLDTHLHNDYVSGGLELARRTGAASRCRAASRSRSTRDPQRRPAVRGHVGGPGAGDPRAQ